MWFVQRGGDRRCCHNHNPPNQVGQRQERLDSETVLTCGQDSACRQPFEPAGRVARVAGMALDSNIPERADGVVRVPGRPQGRDDVDSNVGDVAGDQADLAVAYGDDARLADRGGENARLRPL